MLPSDSLLSLLFRETDRAQRMGTALSAVLVAMDSSFRPGERSDRRRCEQLLAGKEQRIQAMLRSYDLLGRMGPNELLLVLPGCGLADAKRLAERIRAAVFPETESRAACFSVAAAKGRSAVVLLQELRRGMEAAKTAGAGAIRSAEDASALMTARTASTSGLGDDLFGW